MPSKKLASDPCHLRKLFQNHCQRNPSNLPPFSLFDDGTELLQQRRRRYSSPSMDWIHRRSRYHALTSLSAPPFHLIAIFAIVVLLLLLSRQAENKAQVQRETHFLFFLLPFVLTFVVGYLLIVNGGLHYFQTSRIGTEPLHRMTAAAAETAGSFPWGVAILVSTLLVMLSYQSSFHSKWLGT